MAKNLTKLIIFVCVLVVLVLLGGLIMYFKANKKSVKIITEKKEYSANEEMKVEIKNDTGKKICFSSCYPYAIQFKNNGWNNYSYADCGQANLAGDCIDPNGLKTFEISLGGMFLDPVPHRLAVSACVGCTVGENFRVDETLYSNEFQIKK